MSKTSERQLAWAKAYIGTLDEIKIRVPKGEKEHIREFAEGMGESMNAFIYRAIKEAMGWEPEAISLGRELEQIMKKIDSLPEEMKNKYFFGEEKEQE